MSIAYDFEPFDRAALVDARAAVIALVDHAPDGLLLPQLRGALSYLLDELNAELHARGMLGARVNGQLALFADDE